MKKTFVDIVVEQAGGESPIRFEVKTLANAMYCTRGVESDALIEEFTAHVPEKVRELKLPSLPGRVPAFCKASRYLLTTEKEIEVQGNETCGEVEVVALVDGDEILIGVGSDHCDRAIEPYFYYKTKQMCPRVLGPRVWRYEDIKDHWDELELSATMAVDGQETPFQRGTLSELVPFSELLANSGYQRDGLVIYCGTVAIEEYAYGETFTLKLHDPVLGRTLQHGYSIRVLNQMS